MAKPQNVYVVAGPNGSGKTTFAREFLPNYAKCDNFVNADLIAQGLSPFDPRTASIKAGKLVLSRIREFAEAGEDFGYETTLAGRNHLRMFKRLRERGCSLHLFFLWVPAVELSLLRIKNRVAEGGHDVQPIDVRRRYIRSISNVFAHCLGLVDTWMVFDNSGQKPILAARSAAGKAVVENADVYRSIMESVTK